MRHYSSARGEMPLREVLELGPGDVVELEPHVSEPVDLVSGTELWHERGGLVNGNFALRVTRSRRRN